MTKLCISLFLVAVLIGCNNGTKRTSEITDTLKNENQIEAQNSPTASVAKSQPQRSLDIDSLFNWQEFKSYHKGAQGGPAKLNLLYNSGYGHYRYYYFTKHFRRYGTQGYPAPAAFQVVTALENPFDPDTQFLDMNESLVALQCEINDPNPGGLDLVGTLNDDLDERFGDPIYLHEKTSVYGGNTDVIVADFADNKVERFKILSLEHSIDSVLNASSLRDKLLSFDHNELNTSL